MGFDAISCGGTIFFLFLDSGVPPPDTAQSPGTLAVIAKRHLIRQIDKKH
jgi:hypothetical protein